MSNTESKHVMSSAPVPRCIYCGADEDDVFVGNEPCTPEREAKASPAQSTPQAAITVEDKLRFAPTRVAKYVAIFNRINAMNGSTREDRYEFEFSKTGVSQRGTTVEDYARSQVSEITGGYAQLLRVEKVEAA